MCRTVAQSALILTVVTLLAACSARLVSKPVPKSVQTPAPPTGLTYALPQTVVQAEFPVKVNDTKAGKYDKFLDLYFPALKPKTPGRKVKIGAPKFDTSGEPDPRQVYTVRGEGSGAIEQNLTLTFSEGGAVKGLKGTVDNSTDEIITSSVGSVLGILSKLYGRPAKALLSTCQSSECNLERFLVHEELIQNFRSLSSNRRSQLVAIHGTQGTADYRLLLNAQQTYTTYRDLVAGRIAALKHPNEPGAPHLLETSDAERAAIVADFVGSNSTLSWTARFDVVPDECDATRQAACGAWTSGALLSYVPDKGLCGPILLPGVGLPDKKMMAKASDCTGQKTAVKIHLDVLPAVQVVHRFEKVYSKPGQGAFFYIVPIRTVADLRTEAGANVDILGQVSLLIAQRGIVTALPVDLGGKSVTHDLTLYDSTGAIKSYQLVSKPALTKGTVESLGTSVGSFIEAREKQREAENEAADELTQLKRKFDLLDLAVKIRAHCATLGIPEEECDV